MISVTTNTTCTSIGGINCPSPYTLPCEGFNLSLTTGNQDQCYANSISNELASKSGTTLFIYKLLGITETPKLLDLTGKGRPISSGTLNSNFLAANAFTLELSEWRSSQTGVDVLASAYIGYDFGPIQIGQRNRYSPDDGEQASVRLDVGSIRIVQGDAQEQRATKIRVERSNDARIWYGAAILDVADNCDLQTIQFQRTVPSRYWRIRPVTFNGINTNQPWTVKSLQLVDAQQAGSINIEDQFFNENRDQDYSKVGIALRATYDVADSATPITPFGIQMDQKLIFDVTFSLCVAALGRPLVIGDLIEVPSEAQYDVNLRKIPKLVEVSDIAWSPTGYTPGWVPTVLRVTTDPANATQENKDVTGSISTLLDDLGLQKAGITQFVKQDYDTVTQHITAQEGIYVPQLGDDNQGSTNFGPDELAIVPNKKYLNLPQRGARVEDAIPPNAAPYTEGDTFPVSPANGDWHRLKYTGNSADVPVRLFVYNTIKNKWLYQETDRRSSKKTLKPLLQEFLDSSTRKSADIIK